MMPSPDNGDDGLVTCEWCEGRFLSSDMEGEHCRCCADELFGEEPA